MPLSRPEPNSDRRVLLLCEADNVCVTTGPLESGETVQLGDTLLQVANRVPMGHKIAVRPIAAGDKVVKYGAPIGSATRDIAPGEHVHTHNLRSDYIATYTLDAADFSDEANG